MRAILSVFLTGALALGFVAAIVLGTNDREILTAPPEAVAENFVRSLATGRHGAPARRGLTDELKTRTAHLIDLSEAIRRRGEIIAIDAIETADPPDSHRADVVITIHYAGKESVAATLPLVRTQGLWRITSLDWRPAPLR